MMYQSTNISLFENIVKVEEIKWPMSRDLIRSLRLQNAKK